MPKSKPPLRTPVAPAPAPATAAPSEPRPWARGPRIVYFPSKHPLLSESEMAEIFASLGEDSPVARAIRQLIQQRTAAAISSQADSRGNPDSRAHAAGRLEELLGLQNQLVSYQETPTRRAKSV